MSATTERKTITRIDIEHAIDAREEARVKIVHACHRAARNPGDWIFEGTMPSTDTYVAACLELQNLLDRWEDQLRGWEEGA
jgi:hypothetical protein